MPQQNVGDSQPGTTTLRNEPVQARSTARLTRLLDAAAEVIDEIGFERLTTAMVAERAGASIGTVYRYFPDRIAVLQSLSARTRAEVVEELTRELANEGHDSWLSAFESGVGVLTKSFANRKGFRSLRFGDVIDIHPAPGSHTNNAFVTTAIERVLVARFNIENRAVLGFHLEVALEIADGLLARAFAIKPNGDGHFIEAAKSATRNYLIGALGDPA